jgi:hypothetical protein
MFEQQNHTPRKSATPVVNRPVGEGMKGLEPNIFSIGTCMRVITIPDRVCNDVHDDLFLPINPSHPSRARDSRTAARAWAVKDFAAGRARPRQPFTSEASRGLA